MKSSLSVWKPMCNISIVVAMCGCSDPEVRELSLAFSNSRAIRRFELHTYDEDMIGTDQTIAYATLELNLADGPENVLIAFPTVAHVEGTSEWLRIRRIGNRTLHYEDEGGTRGVPDFGSDNEFGSLLPDKIDNVEALVEHYHDLEKIVSVWALAPNSESLESKPGWKYWAEVDNTPYWHN